MGLSVHYDWRVKADVAAARKLVRRFHSIARSLPFDRVTEIFEQDPPGGEALFKLSDHDFRFGDLYLPRKRDDGEEELVDVPALHAVFFTVRVEGAESASIGLASHPPVVVHREDVLKRGKDGRVRERLLGRGKAIEFPTRRRGWYSWHSSCKTQYADNPKLGGEANFLKAHLSLIELLDRIGECGAKVRIRDDSKYAKHRDSDKLLKSVREWNAIVARFVGAIGDALGGGVAAVAPIKDRPDFEHLEAKGIDALKRLARRRRRRKKGDG